MDKQLEELSNIAHNLRLMQCDLQVLTSKPLAIEQHDDVVAYIGHATLEQCQQLADRLAKRVDHFSKTMLDPRRNLAEAAEFLADAALDLKGAVTEQKVAA